MNCGGLRNDHFETPAQINQFLLLVLCGRHLVDEDFPVSSQHLDSWTVQDGQAAISRC